MLLAMARYRGTEISNPFPSSKESIANRTFLDSRPADGRRLLPCHCQDPDRGNGLDRGGPVSV